MSIQSFIISFFILHSILISICSSTTKVFFHPSDLTLTPQEKANFTLSSSYPLNDTIRLHFNSSDYFQCVSSLLLYPNQSSIVEVTAISPVNEEFLEVSSCEIEGEINGTDCPLDLKSSFGRIRIIRSHALDVIVDIVGWAYFLAWSISFWPQIILNFQRKSVIGLNFDFVLLNTIGFASYTVYNCLIFFDADVQSEYKDKFPRSPIPVLLNDVVFAAHAFLACTITGIQAIFMEKDKQRVSRICIGWSSILILCAITTSILSLTNVITLLSFVDSLSYIKMAVTLSKYFPQVIFNWRRKSTIGWSIGNILLDFTGGVLDLLQVALQGVNVANFSAIIGNPVKFGLGLVSIIFDIVFMFQHYVLYRHVEVPSNEYEGIDNEGGPSTPPLQEDDNIDANSTSHLE